MAMLDAIDKFRWPIGPANWDQVVDASGYEDYCLENGRASRDVGAIHRKFISLVNFPKPTGDPTRPPDIKRAKEISRMINESVEMADNSSALSSHSPASSRASDTSRAGSEAPPVSKRGTAASEVPLSRKKNNRGLTDSLAAFLDVEKREERDRKYDIITLYQSQIEHLRQALRDSKEDCRDWRQKVEELRQKFDEERFQFQRERIDLLAERDRALPKVMVLELLNSKS
ncbi:hypothetical protein V1522DRAFT_460114 [Lipomyces starkeyi]